MYSFFSQKLRSLMQAKNISLAELSTKTEIPLSSLYRYYNGESNPNVLVISSICDAFNIGFEFFNSVGYVKIPEKKDAYLETLTIINMNKEHLTQDQIINLVNLLTKKK